MKFYVGVFFIIFGISSCSREVIPCDLIIADVNIIDVEHDTILPHRYIAIKGERILKVSAQEIMCDSARIIDGKGKYLMPGLWDMHAHYWWSYENNGRLLIANGVTGIREMFGDLMRIQVIRAEVKEGKIFTPELVSSGPIIDGVPATWPGSDTITTALRAKEVIEKQTKEGVDFFKVYSGLSKICYLELAKEAKKRNIPFAGHVPKDVSIYEAIDAGQKSAEHLYGILKVCTKYPVKLAELKNEKWPFTKTTDFLISTFDEKKLDSLLNKLAKSETWICPTLTVLNAIANLRDTNFVKDARIKYLPGYVTQGWKGYSNLDTAYLNGSKKTFALQKSFLGKMQRAGVKILAGTDFPNPYCFPGFSIHDELRLMVEGGTTPTFALKTATINPAIYLNKLDYYGTIDEGKFASLVLLDKNPLENINNTKEICSVFLKGKFFSRKDIATFLNVK